MYATAPFVLRLRGGRCTRRRCNSSRGEANDPGGGSDADRVRVAFRDDRQIFMPTVTTFLREAAMPIFLIILVSVLLLALFVGVTVAGGRSHDRQNKRHDNDR